MSERPLCDFCDSPVSGDHYYNINGDVICADCMEEYFRRELDDDGDDDE